MRRQLIGLLQSEALADECLKRILAHLVAAGFGKDKQGKLRDFLLKGVRSAAKAAVADMPEGKRPVLNLESLTSENEQWLTRWREGLIERAWRSMERLEHAHPEEPVYKIYRAATDVPKATPAQLAKRISAKSGEGITEQAIVKLLPIARTQFAQFIADEVAETLGDPTREEITREIKKLGLGRAFQGVQV